jgi:hypothetical protein
MLILQRELSFYIKNNAPLSISSQKLSQPVYNIKYSLSLSSLCFINPHYIVKRIKYKRSICVKVAIRNRRQRWGE